MTFHHCVPVLLWAGCAHHHFVKRRLISCSGGSSQMRSAKVFFLWLLLFCNFGLWGGEICQTRRCTTVSPSVNCVPETWFCPLPPNLKKCSSGTGLEFSLNISFLRLKCTKKKDMVGVACWFLSGGCALLCTQQFSQPIYSVILLICHCKIVCACCSLRQ